MQDRTDEYQRPKKWTADHEIPLQPSFKINTLLADHERQSGVANSIDATAAY
jgi:hypothetical protein